MSEISEERLDRLANTGDLTEVYAWTEKLIAEIRRLRAENAGLRPLAKLGAEAVEDCAWHASDFDGEEIQERAVALGVIVETTFDPKRHVDALGVGMEAGDPWFVFSDSVLAARRALDQGS